MSDTAERVAVVCPSCSPEFETVHEVLKPGGQATVRCTECGHVHKTKIEEEQTEEIDVIVSQEGESFTATADVPIEETLAVGEEFVLETEEAIFVVRITSLEQDANRRVEESAAEDVETIWTRAVDNVSVNVTIHPKDGRRDDSRGIKVNIPGDYEFVVGETEELADEEFTIDGILVTDDATGYNFDRLDHDGDSVVAKDVKRIYADDESSTAWSAW
ncbi:HVO_0476 family zinc finger protein [Haladaptatus sp. NG-SE-30]